MTGSQGEDDGQMGRRQRSVREKTVVEKTPSVGEKQPSVGEKTTVSKGEDNQQLGRRQALFK